MLVLGIETSTTQATVAIGSEDGVVAEALVAQAAPNEFLLPAIRFCLDQSGLGYHNLAGVAVGLGPGLFTGMRVGVATAKALAQSLSVPITGFVSLDVLAYEVRYTHRVICAVLDARRQEVFYAFYRASPGGVQRMSEYLVAKPEKLAIRMAASPEEVLLVGNGAILYRDVFEDLGSQVEIGRISQAFPEARLVVELGLARMTRGHFDSVYSLKPVYLRRSAKRIHWERARREGAP
jgi:tRNA threonylcarbamoyladenosine biosynthesis protein TsaB